MASIFTKIINGEIPSYKIHEDELTYTFLNINPIQLGHLLIVPKQEVDHIIDADDESYLQVYKNAKIIGKALQKVTSCKRIGYAVQGFEVPHFHLHLIPMLSPEDFLFERQKPADNKDLGNICEKIIEAL
ncbi:MAG: HIT family protein [Bdellovibrionaceae bacterium]|nr:HIT family protein [Pseudobdellovibrionaceae bacterium]